MSGLACSMFSETVRPLVRSKSADCLATTLNFWSATLWKPSPRSRVAEAPGMPSSSATFTPSPSFLIMYSAAISPPFTLSEATREAMVPLSALRSRAITGIFALLAASTEVEMAAESTGFTKSTLTPCWSRSATSLACFAGSFWASTIFTLTPSSLAFASTPSLTETKNGLFKVEMEKPIVVVPLFLSAAGADSSPELQPAISITDIISTAITANKVFFI